MRITISPRIRADHDLVARLVTAGFTGVDRRDVEVHLKAAAAQATRWLVRCQAPQGCGRPVNYRAGGDAGHCARTRRQALALAADQGAHHPPQRLAVRRRYPYTGRAYHTLPDVARVAPGVRYLVTLKMPADPEATGDAYPRSSRYERYKTAPPITIHHWTEELVHLAAHEARHTHQIRHGLPRSEIDAERWAHAVLQSWRQPTTGRARGDAAAGPTVTASLNSANALSAALTGRAATQALDVR